MIRHYLLVFIGCMVVGSSLSSKVKFISSQRYLDETISLINPLSVVFCYNEPRNLVRDDRKTISYAKKGFKEASYLDAYEVSKIKFSYVNLEKLPHLKQQYNLSDNHEIGHILLFKDGKNVAVKSLEMHKDSIKNIMYQTTKNLIDALMGNDIKELIKKDQEYKKELMKIRAANAARFIGGYYGGYYNGYAHPHWRGYYHRPELRMYYW